MKINRREFLVLASALAAGCQAPRDGGGSATSGKQRVVNAGAVADYAADGVYARFRNQGFFIVRRGEQLLVLSSNCTHRRCKLTAETDKSFYCPCHGSTFDPVGKVTEGPARRDLPTFPSSISETGELLVTIRK